MVYIYDILMNWCKGRIYEFYEWSKNDDIEHIKKIRLMKVSSEVLEDFFNYKIKLDNEEVLRLRTKDNKTNNIKILYTDGYRSLAIKFNSMGESISKSRLLLDEEEEVLNVSIRLDISYFNYEKSKKYVDDFLTRREKYVKNYLLNNIISDYKNKNKEKLKYIYYEMFDIEVDDIEVLYNRLVNSLNNITNKHFKLFDILNTNLYKKQV